jgi:hypothetical protein
MLPCVGMSINLHALANHKCTDQMLAVLIFCRSKLFFTFYATYYIFGYLMTINGHMMASSYVLLLLYLL